MAGDLGPRAVIAALGIDVQIGSSYPDEYARTVGCNPTMNSWIERDPVTDLPRVHLIDDTPTAWAYALHEAVHLVLGIETFQQEFGMMAVEHAIARELADPWWSEWRAMFAYYGLLDEDGLDVIGSGDAFLDTSTWARVVRDAVRRGWMLEFDAVAVPVWGAGVHPSLVAEGTYDGLE